MEERSNVFVDANNIYITKEDGGILPVNHPDISTQPSILPQRFGKLKINEVLILISSKTELTDQAITNFNNEYARIKEGEFIYPGAGIIDIRLLGDDRILYPTKAIKENSVWKIYFNMSEYLNLKYCLIKYTYNNHFK